MGLLGVGRKKDMDIKSEILSTYCQIACTISAHEPILSSVYISKRHNLSLYKARKLIRELVDEGLLVKDHEGGLSDWDWQVHCYHGYRITRKAEETMEYRKAAYQEAKYEAEWLGGSMFSHWKRLRRRCYA